MPYAAGATCIGTPVNTGKPVPEGKTQCVRCFRKRFSPVGLLVVRFLYGAYYSILQRSDCDP